MNITDQEIVNYTQFTMLSKELLYALQDVEEPEEKERLQVLLELHARDLGIEKQFRLVIKQFNKAQQNLADYYRRENAKQRASIDLEFDGTGRPISSIENFVRVLTNDPKFAGLKFNLLTYSPEQIRNGKPERWLDSDDAEMVELQHMRAELTALIGDLGDNQETFIKAQAGRIVSVS